MEKNHVFFGKKKIFRQFIARDASHAVSSTFWTKFAKNSKTSCSSSGKESEIVNFSLILNNLKLFLWARRLQFLQIADRGLQRNQTIFISFFQNVMNKNLYKKHFSQGSDRHIECCSNNTANKALPDGLKVSTKIRNERKTNFICHRKQYCPENVPSLRCKASFTNLLKFFRRKTKFFSTSQKEKIVLKFFQKRTFSLKIFSMDTSNPKTTSSS